MNKLLDFSEGNSGIKDIETEWDALVRGEGEIGLYLYHLDRFLMGFMATDEVVLAGIDALSQRYLNFMYPEGEAGPKRNPTNCTKTEIEKAGLHPDAIKNLLSVKSLELSQDIKHTLLDGISDKRNLH